MNELSQNITRNGELLPCPFCGGEANTLNQAPNGVGYSVGCGDDECRGFIALSWIYPTEAEAIAAWNTRAGGYCAFAQPTDLTDGCALLEKRTCRFVDDSDGEFPPKCSSCGYEPSVYECSWFDDGGYVYEANYCPECGARVIGVVE